MNPETIGRYRILGRLGQGGQAIAYAAHDPDFDRQVAIKVLLREQLADETSRARFLLEARAIASLEHPSIVPVYDFGSDDGQLYIVMRFMPGGTLEDRLEREALSLAETITILERVAQALDAAHRAGFIHRDVKPANILFDAHGNAHLGDFGIAKLARSASSLTSAGMSIGSPAYMSPEQARGTAELTPDSDIYSLGIVAYRMLLGRLPFIGNDPFAIMRMHIQDPPGLPTDLHPAVAAALNRVLAKEPPRYDTASHFVDSLRAAVTGPFPSPAPPRSASRRWLFIGGGGLIAAAAIVGSLLAFSGSGGSEPERPTRTPTEEVSKTATETATEIETETETESTPTPGPTVVSIFRLVVGDCFDLLEGGGATEVALVDCADPHGYEVLSLFTVDEDGGFPGEAFFTETANLRCPAGTDQFFAPSAATWANGDREVICVETGADRPTATATATAPPEVITPFDLERGDCFIDRNGNFSQLELVSCDGDFDYEVLSVFNVPDRPAYPGDEALNLEANNRCPRGTDRHLRPSEATWANGDREVICLGDG